MGEASHYRSHLMVQAELLSCAVSRVVLSLQWLALGNHTLQCSTVLIQILSDTS